MSDSDTADNERGPAQWWSEKIKEAFDQGVSAEFCAWQDVQLLRARVAELEAALKYIDEQSFDARVIAKARAALEGK